MVNEIKCPICNQLNEADHKFCVYCGRKLDFDSDEVAYCLNCGRPVVEGQTKCECGYEFSDIECPYCKTHNSYTNNFCTSCGRRIIDADFRFQDIKARGIQYENNMFNLDWSFVKGEIIKNPHQTNNQIKTDVLRNEYLKQGEIVKEICSRWWVVSPTVCKYCKSKIEPLQESCPKCNTLHHIPDYENRIRELKTVKGNYVETKEDIAKLSNLKWTYKLSGSDLNDYFNSLAPAIGESQLEYRKRLLREWNENSLIMYLIKSEWNIYFKNQCMDCDSEYKPYDLYCPSCGLKKDVPALSVLYNDDDIVTIAFQGQYDDFSNQVKEICRDNGGDITHFHEEMVECPKCSNYFHYLTPDFIETHRCPHCGLHFEIDAKIYQNEPVEDDESIGDWTPYGITQDMWELSVLEEIKERREERFKD